MRLLVRINSAYSKNCVNPFYAKVVCTAIIFTWSIMPCAGRGNPDSLEAHDAIAKVDDKTALLKIARNDKKPLIRLYAAWKLGDQRLYAEMAKNNEEEHLVRHYVIQSLNDQNLIAEIAKNDNDWRLREIATGRLDDKTLFAEIMKNDDAIPVR
jgi:hypothetical protein